MISLFLTAVLQQTGPIQPGPPRVERQGTGWQVTFTAEANLPDRTEIQIEFLPKVLRYHEIDRKLMWSECTEGFRPHRAIVENKKAVFRTRVSALREFAVTWAVDTRAQRFGAKVDGEIPPARATWVLGSLGDRMKAYRQGISDPERLHARLRTLLKQLEEGEKSRNRDLSSWCAAIAEVRNECESRMATGPFTASLGLLDSVAGDAATYAAWLRKERLKRQDVKSEDDAKHAQYDQGSKDPLPAEGTGSSTSKGRRDNRNIRLESSGNLAKRLDVFSRLHRAEFLLLLAVELRALAGASMGEWDKGLEIAESKLGEERDSTRPLREGRSAILLGDPEMLKRAREELETYEKRLSQLSAPQSGKP